MTHNNSPDLCKLHRCCLKACEKPREMSMFCEDHTRDALEGFEKFKQGEKCNHLEHLVEIVPEKRVQIDSLCDVCLNEMACAHEMAPNAHYNCDSVKQIGQMFERIRNCECRKIYNSV